ncbi:MULTISPECIES: hypothetical protein [unclassified Mesorhizobium]|uniref:hypothetical protein n=1 Tax=unclassified Mesorhizobium TaxID=325217 RepID=UPI0003CE80CE|nr:hypothetical protein [Mesorhizobium sp. LSJC280B00]ESW88767.1 hypothetical protein X772_09085 [Mesorhizobium sp. LSJC280B00]
MSNRYATIITDDDGREVVSAIGEFAGTAPYARHGRFEQVAAGVRIGMVRGGTVDAVGGFGFPSGALDGKAVAILRARLNALPDAGAMKPGTTTDAKPASQPRKPKSARAGKKARPRKRIVRPGNKKPAVSAGTAE